MSISFYVKNKKKFLGYESVLTVEKALDFLGRPLLTYNFDLSNESIDINKFLFSSISNYECVLIGEDGKSARGFELSYDKEEKHYAVRIYTPCSREDWLLALEYIKTLAKKFNSEISNEREEVYTVNNIDDFDYESDILFGIKSISSRIEEDNSQIHSIFGVNRVVDLNKKMIEEIDNSANPIDTFSAMIKEIQYLDAYSARQFFYANEADSKIMGSYTLTENLRTILPYKPYVEFENLEIVENDEVSFWNISLVTIDGDENDRESYNVAGELNYDEFIQKIPINKYNFIDGTYIMIEPLTKEEILELLK
ncbi:MAG: DUF4299 family protein [Fusobacterium sp.]|uniref:DUF4299 family protein n=1 Tax=Fusobacterium sp. TaxID=68766 RepID=UPI0026DC33A0|nr:DUF4299 family protein [Fusobacterium sp.]MDO4690765.1 DUF4299 family protein [Fusobacterium sp.]